MSRQGKRKPMMDIKGGSWTSTGDVFDGPVEVAADRTADITIDGVRHPPVSRRDSMLSRRRCAVCGRRGCPRA